MADLRFGRGHRDALCFFTKREFYCLSFDAVVEERRCAMQVDVINLFGHTSGVLHRQCHCTRRLVARLFKPHAMVGVARRAVARNLRVDIRAASHGTLILFENVHPRALAEHDA